MTPKDDYSFAFNMTLADGGRAETRIALPPSIIEMSAACVSDAGQFCGGFDIRGEIGDCETDACGLCRCEGTSDSEIGPATWSRTAGKLILNPQTYPKVFDFCVQGNTLDLQTRAGLRIVLERVEPTGTPLACSQRELARCLGSGCHVGVCTGGTECMGRASEADCTNRVGCAWDASHCGGQAAAACSFSDYDATPGCVFEPVR